MEKRHILKAILNWDTPIISDILQALERADKDQLSCRISETFN